MINMDDAQAIREYVVDKVTLIIDNHEPLLDQVREAALSAIQHDTGENWSRDDFLTMLNGRGQVDRIRVAEVVGLAVCEVIGDWLNLSDPVHAMLSDLLDLGDREQAVLFGEHYMPEADDWPADEDE